MKFTKNDLLESRAMREAQALEAKKQRAAEHKAWKLRAEAENMEKVRTAFKDGLARLIQEADIRGVRSLQLHEYKVFESGGEVYSPPFTLGFNPDPGYRPTQRLLRLLQESGFKASVSSRQVEDITWVNDCVGFEGLGTYHTEHYIVVSW